MEGIAIKTQLTMTESTVYEFNAQVDAYQSFCEDRKVLFTDIENPGEILVSSKNQYLFVNVNKQFITVFDITTKEKVNELTYEGVLQAFSEENDILVIAGSKGLAIWNIKDFTLIGNTGDEYDIRSVSVSPDGLWAVTGHRDGTLAKWILKTMQEENTIFAHQKTEINKVAIFPDGLLIASSGGDRKVRIWSSNLEVVDEQRITGKHSCLSVTSDNFIISGGGSTNVLVWKYLKTSDFMNGKVNSKFKSFSSVAVTYDSKYLFAYDSSIRVFSLETKEEDLKFPLKGERVKSMCISRDNSKFFASTENNHIYSFNLREDYKAKFIDSVEKGITSLTISQDSRYIAATFNNRKLRLIDRELNKSTNYQFDKAVSETFFSEDNAMMISGIQDSTVCVKTLDGSRKDIILNAHRDEIRSVSGNSDIFITTCGDRTLKLWDTGNFCCLRTICVSCERLRDAYVSPDGEHIVVLADNDIQIWKVNMESDSPIKIIEAPHERVACIGVSKQGNEFFTVGYDFEIRIWSFANHLCMSVMSLPSFASRVENIKEICVASSDDKYLFTASSSGIQIWSLNDQIYLGNIPINDITAFTITNDNSALIVADHSKIYEIINPTCETSPAVLVLAPFEYSFKFWELLKQIFNLKIDESYPEIMNHCIIMPHCINLLHIFTHRNQLDLLEAAIDHGCSFIRNANGKSPLTLSLDTKNKDCIKRITKKIVTVDDPNILIRIETDLIRLNKCATESLVHFYKQSFKEPSEKLPKFAIPLKSPVNFNTSISRTIDPTLFIAAQSREEIRSEKDVLLNFKVSNFRLNYTLGSQESIDFLVSLINCTEGDIFKTQFIQSILYYKWSRVQLLLAAQGSLYTLFVVFLSFYTSFGHAEYALHPLLFLNFLFLVYEIMQMTVGCVDYFKEFWNWADLFRIMAFNVYYIYTLFGIDENTDILFIAVITFFTWTRAIAYFRVFKETRYLIRIIQDIIAAIMPFLAVLFYSILTFALLFYAMNNYSIADTPFNKSWRHSYLIDYGDFTTDGYSWKDWVIFVMSTIINPLIMMNLLIALMNDTYAKVQEDSMVADFKEMAGFILEFESIMVWRRENGRKEFFQQCSVTEVLEDKDETLETIVLEKMAAMTQRINSLSLQAGIVENKHEEIAKQMQDSIALAGDKMNNRINELNKKIQNENRELLDEVEKLLSL